MATPWRVIKKKGGNRITGLQRLNLMKPIISLLNICQKIEIYCVQCSFMFSVLKDSVTL